MVRYKRLALFTAALFIGTSAALNGRSSLYAMCSVLLMLPLASYLFGSFGLQHLKFDRQVPRFCWSGDAAELAVIVLSTAKSTKLFLEVKDNLPEWVEPVTPDTVHMSAPAMETTRVPYQVRPLKRGAYALNTFTVTSRDPLGIYAFSARIQVRSELLVYPVPQELPPLFAAGNERFGFRDTPLATVRGSGIDPDGVREYVPGDPLRRMHWKSTARTGRLNVIEFEESRAVSLIVALDLHAERHTGSGVDSTEERLIRAAASCIQIGLRQGAPVTLILGDKTSVSHTSERGSESLHIFLAALARAETHNSEDIWDRTLAAASSYRTKSSVVILTAGRTDTLGTVVRRLIGSGVGVTIVHAASSAPPTKGVVNQSGAPAEAQEELAVLRTPGAHVYSLEFTGSPELRLTEVSSGYW